MHAIVDIQLLHLVKLLEDRNIAIKLDQPAKDWLAERGFDPIYGARPLKRIIQRYLQNPLANEILKGEIADSDTVIVGAGDDGLLINGHLAQAA
jgi:ATP-dependent Clp protease ATP-binding subunit ClpB